MQVLAEKAPQVLSMAEELPSLQRACAVSTPALLEELAHLSRELREAQAELRRCEQEEESAPFLSAAGEFVVRTALTTFGKAKHQENLLSLKITRWRHSPRLWRGGVAVAADRPAGGQREDRSLAAAA